MWLGEQRMAPETLVGSYIVFPTFGARDQAWNLCDNKARELWKLRKHAFKLVWWPQADTEPETDIDWCWIKGFERLRIGELRIDEPINGKNNVRVVFFKANEILASEPTPRIWLLSVFPKKRQDFGKGQLAAFRGMRTIIVDRYYDGSQTA
jgi:hypothetical protein